MGIDESEFVVNGMTCAHCEQALRTALSEVPGVVRVEADATSGRVRLQQTGPVAHAAVESAVTEAGYSVLSWATDRL
ncbi:MULTISPECIES: heavy-metal-associated domain-containing protein [Microbacterium]|uniref:heavy-metal-associated domain-containing protein n=1 Tax=Microbacterium TaxID=33882 RepID=UPI001E48823A|nr:MULTISPECIES: heavy metal-associated domain-containing protein [Microbacterium]|tara:strand:+ start:3866 stop:4096 length:231 start_codon:yes stop_codon:yes gene_type:complete